MRDLTAILTALEDLPADHTSDAHTLMSDANRIASVRPEMGFWPDFQGRRGGGDGPNMVIPARFGRLASVLRG